MPDSLEALIADRDKTHGPYEVWAATAVAVEQALFKFAPPDRVRALSSAQFMAVRMVGQKLARIVCGDPLEEDHWRDIMGYAKLGWRAIPDTAKERSDKEELQRAPEVRSKVHNLEDGK